MRAAARFSVGMALLGALLLSPSVFPQTSQSGGQSTSQPPCDITTQTGPAGSGNGQSDPSLAAQTQQLKDAAKQLGSLFKKKPSTPTAAAPSPCSAPAANATASATPMTGGAAPVAAANPAPAASGAPQGGNTSQPASFVQALQAAQAQIPAPPAGGLDTSKLPDILGIHIGSPTNQVSSQIAALFPVVRPGTGPQQFGPYPPGHIKYAPTNDPPYISSQAANRANPDGCGPTDCQASDIIAAIFSGPPDTRVVSLQRTLSYSSERLVSTDTFKNSLIQKYGSNYTQFPVNVMLWAFDEQGKPLTLSKSDATCARGEGPISQQGYPPPNAYSMTSYLGILTPVPLQQQQAIASVLRSKCVKGIIVTADLGAQPGGMSQQLQVTIVDTAEDLRDAFAAEIYLQQSANAKASQQLKNAQQQSAPTF
jgi:hypothetical protein